MASVEVMRYVHREGAEKKRPTEHKRSETSIPLPHIFFHIPFTRSKRRRRKGVLRCYDIGVHSHCGQDKGLMHIVADSARWVETRIHKDGMYFCLAEPRFS